MLLSTHIDLCHMEKTIFFKKMPDWVIKKWEQLVRKDSWELWILFGSIWASLVIFVLFTPLAHLIKHFTLES